jgi:hypothetical protein
MNPWHALDSRQLPRQNSGVRRWLILLLIALISSARLAAQPTTTDFTEATPEVSVSRNNSSLLTKDRQLQRDDVIVGKKYTVTGLLVWPIKAIKLHKAGSALTKLLQAINPFSRENDATEEARFEGELSTSAWTSSVGWHPGASGFPNAVTHEVGLTFVSVGR